MTVPQDDELRVLESHKTLLSSNSTPTSSPRRSHAKETNLNKSPPTHKTFLGQILHFLVSEVIPNRSIPFTGNQTPTKPNNTKPNPPANFEIKDLIQNEPIKNKTKQNHKQKRRYKYGHDSSDQEPRHANDDFPSHPKKNPAETVKPSQKNKSQSTLFPPK